MPTSQLMSSIPCFNKILYSNLSMNSSRIKITINSTKQLQTLAKPMMQMMMLVRTMPLTNWLSMAKSQRPPRAWVAYLHIWNRQISQLSLAPPKRLKATTEPKGAYRKLRLYPSQRIYRVKIEMLLSMPSWAQMTLEQWMMMKKKWIVKPNSINEKAVKVIPHKSMITVNWPRTFKTCKTLRAISHVL